MKKKILAALITASFFAIHPMHVESVAWISERKDVMYSFFFLLSLIKYLDYVQILDYDGVESLAVDMVQYLKDQLDDH
jgi:hypothetical protein